MAAQRKIIHVDADCFYAAVEVREDPSLAGKPIAVGGRASRRGVIATASYEARQFGVRSAMASSRAMTLCPQLIILPPRFDLYRAVSQQFHEIFRDYTDKVEPLSLDEAYLDVSACTRCEGSATLIAEEIRRRVRESLSLTVSAGIAPNKFLAKVASDWDKPDGQYTVAPADVAAFVQALPVSRINGVGKVMTAKLGKMGVTTCGDLQQIPLDVLVTRFGKYGKRLSELAQGVDDRPVQPARVRKSISVERTYADDIDDPAEMQVAVTDIVAELEQRFDKVRDRYLPVKRFIKVKFSDFRQTTLEEVLPGDGSDWFSTQDFQRLLQGAWVRGSQPVRLLGAGFRLRPLTDENSEQLALFEEAEESLAR